MCRADLVCFVQLVIGVRAHRRDALPKPERLRIAEAVGDIVPAWKRSSFGLTERLDVEEVWYGNSAICPTGAMGIGEEARRVPSREYISTKYSTCVE